MIGRRQAEKQFFIMLDNSSLTTPQKYSVALLFVFVGGLVNEREVGSRITAKTSGGASC